MDLASTWGFASLNDPATERHLLRQVGVIIAANRYTHEFRAFGCCFRIFNARDGVLCVTAAHVLEAAMQHAGAYRLHDRPVDEWPMESRTEAMANISVAFDGLPQGQSPRLHTYSLSGQSDLALFVLQLAVDLPEPPPAVLAIDSDLRPPGGAVMIAGLVGIELSQTAAGGGYRVTATPNLQCRGGVISDLTYGRLVRGPVYETTIPIEPGMSGSPVIVMPLGKPGPVRVIGVASTNTSSSEARATPGIPGHSHVVPIGMAYGLEFHAASVSHTSLRELCCHGAVVDLGSHRDSIEIERDGDSFVVTLNGPPIESE